MRKKQTNEQKIGLSAVLRRGPINQIAFGYVAARTKCGMGWKESIRDFLRHFGLDETEIDEETIRKELNRMTLDYLTEGL